MPGRILLFILIGLSFRPAMAQKRTVANGKSINSINSEAGTYYYSDRNSPPRAIEFKDGMVASSQFPAQLNAYTGIPSDFTFSEVESNVDQLGMRHRLLQQYYKGLPLEGMVYRVHERNGFITSVNGRVTKDVNINTEVILNEEHAFNLAVKYLNSKDSIFRNGKKLIVSKGFTYTPDSYAIAYQFDIDVSFIEAWRISIDARTGQLINKVSLVSTCLKDKKSAPPVETGTGLTSYYGTQSMLVTRYDGGSTTMAGQTENGVSIGTYDFRNVSEISLLLFFEYSEVYNFYSWDGTYNSNYHKPAVSVQWAAEKAFNYYLNKHNRNSYDNNGGAITCYAHVGSGMDNAFWLGNHKILAFGDGSNNNPLVELDVVSHELTHGVTQYEANLQYYNEPGALNESFSDILGKAIEFDTFGDTATWFLAKHFRTGGLRDMSNPNLQNQPDTYFGDMWYTGSDDSGGVHYNSGVQNFWFYLLSKGGTGTNDHNFVYAVNPIGVEAAASIAYRNLTEYLSPVSDYFDCRIGSLLATADLYGTNSAAYQEVANAWDAVGVVDEPIITSFEVYDITATTVKLRGDFLPRGDTAKYHFEYGTTPEFGTSSPTYRYIDRVQGVISELQPDTKYYLRLVATNEHGHSYFPTEFKTLTLAPQAKIKSVVDVTETTATLYGQVLPNSLPTSFYFEYGPTPALGMATPSYPLPDTSVFLNISAIITDLAPRQTYYYRLVATNSFASATTESLNFFTAAKPVIFSFTPATASVGAEVTITGENFNQQTGKNIVGFGATTANVLSSTATEIKVTVPSGASLGPISILDLESGLGAESIQGFIPTFTEEFQKNHLQLKVGIDDIYIWNSLVQDMDGDHKPDIVATHYQGVSVFQNVIQGDEILEAGFVRNTYAIQDLNTIDMLVSDVDGNGLKDIVIPYQGNIRIYPNLSVPGFIFFGTPVDVPTGYLRDFMLRDFDQDGQVDIAGFAYGPNGLFFTIFRNQKSKGSLSAESFVQQYVKQLSYDILYVTYNDVTNDGKPDVLISLYYNSSVPFLINNSHHGVFDFQETIINDVERGSFAKYLIQDLNKDGWNDVASNSPYGTGKVALFENKSTSGNFTLNNPVVILDGITQSITTPGDINGDGKVDLVVGLTNRRFIYLKNTLETGEISSSSFETIQEYGMPLVNVGSGTVDTRTTINDLNGDGRPEIINTHSYNFGPHDGYRMEIWQNAPANCPDPTLISINASKYSATIVLPENTTIDDFDIQYTPLGADYWWQTYSTVLYNLSAGYTYQVRARAKCYLDFTEYYYITFSTDCADLNSFAVTNIGVDEVFLTASDLSSLETQYSKAGEEDWTAVSQYQNRISNLQPGTTYDIRVRGRCFTPGEFQYQQFTTICPELSGISISNITSNNALASWSSNFLSDVMLEYSGDNVTWTPIGGTGMMSQLLPSKKYFVRGRMICTNSESDFIQTSFTTPCPEISNLTVDFVSHFEANVSWIDQSNTGHYIITYSVNGGIPVTTLESNTTSVLLTNLSPGTSYTVAVAPDCIGNRIFKQALFSTTCYYLSILSVGIVADTTAELSWVDNFGADDYVIDYSIEGSNDWHTTSTNATNILLSGLRPGTTYEANVYVNCQEKAESYISVTFETSTYAETTFAPNPTDDKITIYPAANLIGRRFILHDIAGRIIAQGELLEYTVDLTNLTAGVYTLKIDGEKPMRIIKH